MTDQDQGSIPAEGLMARFQSTLNPEAMDEIVSRFIHPALNAARQILSDGVLAEDAVQETFLRLVRHPRRYDPRQPFAQWFYSVLRNICRDFLRRQSRHSSGMQRLGRRPLPGEGPIGGNGEWIQNLLGRLPEEDRLVLLLRLQGSMSFEEIGALLGLSREAAKKRAQRGLRRLREQILVPSGSPETYWG